MTEKAGKTMIDRRRCNQCVHWGKLNAHYGVCAIEQRLGQFGPTRKACFRFARAEEKKEAAPCPPER